MKLPQASRITWVLVVSVMVPARPCLALPGPAQPLFVSRCGCGGGGREGRDEGKREGSRERGGAASAGEGAGPPPAWHSQGHARIHCTGRWQGTLYTQPGEHSQLWHTHTNAGWRCIPRPGAESCGHTDGYIHACMYVIHMCTRTHTQMHPGTNMCMHSCRDMCPLTHIYIHMHLHMGTHPQPLFMLTHTQIHLPPPKSAEEMWPTHTPLCCTHTEDLCPLPKQW